MKIFLHTVLSFLFATNLLGQTLTGTITDETGLPVINARITFYSPDTLLFWETRTNTEGQYLFSDLPFIAYPWLDVAAPGKEYYQVNTGGFMDTLNWDVALVPETHPGEWEVVMQSPEPLGGTDLGVLMPDGSLYFCHNSKDPFYFLPWENDTTFAPGHNQVQGCVAPALLPDGKLLFAGGTLQEIYGPGTKRIKNFDPTTGQWQWLTDMLDYRWYPSLATLYDGKVLVVGGGGLDNPIRVNTSEVYDPETGISEAADTIHFGNEVSPILPLFTGEILMTQRPPQLFDPENRQWELAADFVQGPRMPNGDHSDHELVHLPDGRVLAVGYKSFDPDELGSILEMYDPLTDEWSLRSNYPPTRSRAKTVLLPDKKVLVIGGEKEDHNDPTHTNNWGYMNLTDQYDPATGSWRRLDNMSIEREYHAIASLIPDGRVIVVGGEGQPGNEPSQSTVEAFSPPYLFRGIRPEISNLNTTTFQRGESIQFEVVKTNALTGVVLVSHPVLTHFMNSGNNRFLELDFTQNGQQVTADLPLDSLQLMPGWYTLFGMVDDIPSVGKIIQIEAGLSPISSIGNATLEQLSVAVFPNPAHHQFQVSIENLVGGENVLLELFNINGQLIHHDIFKALGRKMEREVVLPDDMPASVLTLRISIGNNVLTKQVGTY